MCSFDLLFTLMITSDPSNNFLKNFMAQISVRMDNCPICCHAWFDRGVTKVKHLKNASNNFFNIT